MKPVLRLLLGAALGLTGGVACAQVTLVASSWVAPTHILAQTQARWCDDVARATSGRVKCNILPKPVAPPPGTFDAVRDGLADLSFSVHGYTPGRYAMAGLPELPFQGDSAEATSVAYQRVFQRHLARLNEHKGLKVLAVFTHGPGEMYNTKRVVNSLADAQGLKWRVGGGTVNDVGRALGINVTLKPSIESYELLSTGVMDGVMFPPESIEAFRLDKLVRHRTSFPGGLYNTSFAFVMNEAAWNRIPKADQDIIARLSGEHAARMFGRGWDQVDRRGLAVMQASGVQPTVASAAFIQEVRDKTAPLEQRWINEARAKGLPDPERVLREYRAEVGKS